MIYSSSQRLLDQLDGLGKDELHPLLMPEVSLEKYMELDLSVYNHRLENVDVSSAAEIQKYIDNELTEKDAIIAYGGYLEERAIYRRSDYFSIPSDPNKERNIHLGLDLWCDAGTSVYMPVDGKVHSFADNQEYGDYGPTIILEHELDGARFYTLYGHLSRASIVSLEVGQLFDKGEELAELGAQEVNGDYAPHLHFQLITDMEDYWGDFPGVCSKEDLEKFKEICPNPSIFVLKNR